MHIERVFARGADAPSAYRQVQYGSLCAENLLDQLGLDRTCRVALVACQHKVTGLNSFDCPATRRRQERCSGLEASPAERPVQVAKCPNRLGGAYEGASGHR